MKRPFHCPPPPMVVIKRPCALISAMFMFFCSRARDNNFSLYNQATLPARLPSLSLGTTILFLKKRREGDLLVILRALLLGLDLRPSDWKEPVTGVSQDSIDTGVPRPLRVWGSLLGRWPMRTGVQQLCVCAHGQNRPEMGQGIFCPYLNSHGDLFIGLL